MVSYNYVSTPVFEDTQIIFFEYWQNSNPPIFDFTIHKILSKKYGFCDDVADVLRKTFIVDTQIKKYTIFGEYSEDLR